MSDPMHDRGEHYLTTPKAEPFLERVIFNNRALILVAFFVLTLFLGYNAIKIEPRCKFRADDSSGTSLHSEYARSPG